MAAAAVGATMTVDDARLLHIDSHVGLHLQQLQRQQSQSLLGPSAESWERLN